MPISDTNQQAEVQVSPRFYKVARKRATSQAQGLSAICRTFVQQAAALPSLPPPHKTISLRLPEQRKRVRFTVDKEQYALAMKRLHERGLTMSEVIEAGLYRYATTNRVTIGDIQ